MSSLMEDMTQKKCRRDRSINRIFICNRIAVSTIHSRRVLDQSEQKFGSGQ